MRLPLSPIGLHSNTSHTSHGSSDDIFPDETPADSVSPSVDPEATGSNPTPSEGGKQSGDDFWKDLLAKIRAAKAWAWKIFSTIKDDKESESGEDG